MLHFPLAIECEKADQPADDSSKKQDSSYYPGSHLSPRASETQMSPSGNWEGSGPVVNAYVDLAICENLGKSLNFSKV